MAENADRFDTHGPRALAPTEPVGEDRIAQRPLRGPDGEHGPARPA
uniref:Uncharacterized protein n=1 Tax=Streptomyces ambofaciens (strain ATCC 23877 / 3486 / DSM 40053 / JCM 4204 / NBRC 12836 / NRRL B-2516) TaxID=278992 RepID=A0ACK2_STRA7|nr:hypothetical protein SAMR0496 [Streptomyces ambofaciens ATCC 23877]